MVGIIIVFIVAAVYLFFTAFTGKEKVSILKRLNIDYTRKRPIVFLSLPFYPLNTFLLSILGLKGFFRSKLQFINSRLNPEDFMFIKEIFAIGGGFGFYLITNSTDVTLIVIFSIVGFVLPDIWLIDKVKKYKFQILKHLPETIDLLGLCIEAGLDFLSGLRWILEKTQMNPLLYHLRIVVNEIIMGRSRQEALLSLVNRINLPEIRSFANTLIQAERMGTPIHEVFDIISEDARERRIQIGEKQAIRASILIILPLILILGVVIIIIGGPVLIRFKEGGLFGI